MTQIGRGIMNTSNADDFEHFLKNSMITYLASGDNGAIFKAFLNPDVTTTYKYTNIYKYGKPVDVVIFKLIMINEKPISDKIYIDGFYKDIYSANINEFKNEIDIQTDIYLKSNDYLRPICPSIIYASTDMNFNLFTENSYYYGDNKTSDLIGEYNKLSKRCEHIGIIGMEFADGYTPLYRLQSSRFRNSMEYFYMSAFLLLRLAIETGYSQADFHNANIMINTDTQGYFKDIVGEPLLIDYGYAVKIPNSTLRDIITYCDRGRFTTALKFLCTVNRSDGFKMDHPVYGYFCGTKHFLTDLPFKNGRFPEEYNKEIGKYFEAFQDSIKEPTKSGLPMLPLSDESKQSLNLYSGFNTHSSKPKKFNFAAADSELNHDLTASSASSASSSSSSASSSSAAPHSPATTPPSPPPPLYPPPPPGTFTFDRCFGIGTGGKRLRHKKSKKSNKCYRKLSKKNNKHNRKHNRKYTKKINKRKSFKHNKSKKKCLKS